MALPALTCDGSIRHEIFTSRVIDMKSVESFQELVSYYDGFLFDAFGVLLNENGLIHEAAQCFNNLQTFGKAVWIVTNGSSRLESTLEAKYRGLGLNVDASKIISSGGLLREYLSKSVDAKARIAVMGTDESVEYVKQSGTNEYVSKIKPGEKFDALVIANQTDYSLLESLDWALTHLIRCYDKKVKCPIILTNPDLFYPKSSDHFGITAGSIALIIESSLRTRYICDDSIDIIKLGKPFKPIFESAEKKAGSKNLLMIGDQIATDICGANQYGIDSLLVGTGLTSLESLKLIPTEKQPTFLMAKLKWNSSL